MARLYFLSRCDLHFLNPKFNSLSRTTARYNHQSYNPSNKFIINNSYHAKSNVSNSKKIKYYSTVSSLKEKNVFKSRVPDVNDFPGYLYHEFIWKNADNWWNRTAVVCGMTGRSYTYEQLKKMSGRFATSLRKNKIKPGDTIAVVLPNVIEYAIIVMGASEAGVQVTLVNYMYTAQEINKQLNDSDSIAIITLRSKVPVIKESIVGNLNVRLPLIVIEDGSGPIPTGTINFNDLISDNIEEFEKIGFKTERHPENDTFLLPYSSGTSGMPKGVELTHRNLVANHFQTMPPEITIFRDDQEITPIYLPLSHIYALNSIMTLGLSVGAKLIFMPQFSSQLLLNVLQTYKPTILFVVPPVVNLMVHDERFTPKIIESFDRVVCGAAATGEKLISKFLERSQGNSLFAQGYGLTETSPTVSFGYGCPLSSSGKIIPNTEIKIVGYEGKNEGKNLGTNEIGEICVRGPQVMKGYLNNPEATKDTMEGGWFKTGDLGFVDDQSHLYIRERLKELIKVQGMQVAPAELENILRGHDKVADVAVVGVPHHQFGEIPKAFIVPKPNMIIIEQEIKNYVAKQVTKHKQLGHVAVVDQIPKSPSGKILRRELQKI